MARKNKKRKATCIWCRKVSEPYPIHVQCFEILEVYNTMLRVYQNLYPRGWLDFLNLRTRTMAKLSNSDEEKNIMNRIADAGEQIRTIMDDDFWKEIHPEGKGLSIGGKEASG